MENGMEKRENNGENSGPLTSLPVDRLIGGTCNADACVKTLDLEAELYGIVLSDRALQ